jgi:hypothetical protein
MPSHIELVAGKHYSGASDRSIAALPFNHNIKLLLLKLYMMKIWVQLNKLSPSAIRSGIENAYYYKNSIIQ